MVRGRAHGGGEGGSEVEAQECDFESKGFLDVGVEEGLGGFEQAQITLGLGGVEAAGEGSGFVEQVGESEEFRGLLEGGEPDVAEPDLEEVKGLGAAQAVFGFDGGFGFVLPLFTEGGVEVFGLAGGGSGVDGFFGGLFLLFEVAEQAVEEVVASEDAGLGLAGVLGEGADPGVGFGGGSGGAGEDEAEAAGEDGF